VRFDRAYYQRFYLDPRTTVTPEREAVARARLIAATAKYLNLPVRRVLDVGCGLGSLKKPLLTELAGASYTGVEASDWLCRRYGWKRGRVEDYRGRGRFDLVVCYDVFQYLGERAARRAVRNLERLCRGLLYFGALTQEDWDENCVQAQTDGDSILRPDAWYRRALDQGFVRLGLGLWLRHGAKVQLWSLESL
jgi:2-polyprenyl-3-methyl-5-hydroxy-6-metoxy-1,4-benzoquinol methylase